ncbi:MAG: Ca-activated chloride channel family protein [Myxococcota bacterium]|jgi:Ca-activated chloride channel family protein
MSLTSNPLASAPGAPDPSTGARLVSSTGGSLPLLETRVVVRAAAGFASTTLVQRFANRHSQPLRVSYQLPLPADGAVGGFAFVLDGHRIQGEVRGREEARAHFEQALYEGRTAALLEQDRASLFEQEVGNIPPGAEVQVEITVDQPLAWLSEGAWEYRFPTVVAPRYQGAPGRVEDSARNTVSLVADDTAEDDTGASATLDLVIAEPVASEPVSPSHALHLPSFPGPGSQRETQVGLAAEGGAALDRDIVVRWSVATLEPGVGLVAARPDETSARASSAYATLTVIPPSGATELEPVARDLIVLVDTSGSQHGEPMDQSKRVVATLIQSLGESDRLEMIEFSNRPRRWSRKPESMTAAARKRALKWLEALSAGGATEMQSAIIAALAPLRADSQRQILVVTDGLIGFEHEIVGAIQSDLPPSSRVHMVGVGHGVNRSLTTPAARAGRGAELICAPGEDPEPIAARLLAQTGAPLVVDFDISGSALRSTAPVGLPDLFAGAPARIALELDPAGGELLISGRTASGPWRHRVEVAPLSLGEGDPAIARRWARERVADLEVQRATGEDGVALDAAIEQLGIALQIATRRTSWVAVSDQVQVDPTEPTVAQRMPHVLAAGLSAEGLGLRAAASMPFGAAGAAPGMSRMRAGGAAPKRKGRSAPPAPAAQLPASPPDTGEHMLFSMDDASELEEGFVEVLESAFEEPVEAEGLPDVDDAVRDLIPEAVARELGVVALRLEDGRLVLAASKPLGWRARRRLKALTGHRLEVEVHGPIVIGALLDQVYGPA